MSIQKIFAYFKQNDRRGGDLSPINLLDPVHIVLLEAIRRYIRFLLQIRLFQIADDALGCLMNILLYITHYLY